MVNFDNVLGSLARGGPGAVRYDGDSLTNDEEHQYRIDLAGQLEHETELIKFPDTTGSGATIQAAEEKINEMRSMLLKIADAARTTGNAAKAAAPAIRTGTAADPEVQAALEQSSAAYASVKDIVPPDDDTHEGASGHGPAPGGAGRAPATSDDVPEPEVSPSTQVSSAAPPPAAAPAQVPAQAAAGAPPGAAAAPAPAGGGGPTAAPSGFMPGGGGGDARGPERKHRRRDGELGPTTSGSGYPGGEVGGAGVMPIVNPSVTGGRVDPAQISGRTASTSPSAGLPPLKPNTSGSIGAMGGMGGMPMGGAPMGGGAAGRTNLPQPRRDRESERVLTGQEARDKALISHILRDDDPPGEYATSDDILADMVPDQRHPTPARDRHEPTRATDAEPPAVTNAPPPATQPTGPLSEPIPPPRKPGRYPGEPRDDELW